MTGSDERECWGELLLHGIIIFTITGPRVT